MKIVVKDGFNAQNYTISKLYINESFFCHVLEDKNREKNGDGFTNQFGLRKIKGKTAIPGGVYFLEFTMSSRFKKMLPILIDVPWFSGIRIHSGNTELDTDGCLILGNNLVKGKVLFSRLTCSAFNLIIKKTIKNGEMITIEIIRT